MIVKVMSKIEIIFCVSKIWELFNLGIVFNVNNF